jgi:hypothetical protein
MKLKDLAIGNLVVPVRKFQREEWGYCKFIGDSGRGVVVVEDIRGNRHYVNAGKLRKATIEEKETYAIENNPEIMASLEEQKRRVRVAMNEVKEE